jgi:GDP-D-mannose dehydratase
MIPVITGRASKARRILGWQAKTNFHDLVGLMVSADIDSLKEPFSEASNPGVLAQ